MMANLEKQLAGYRLTIAEILYHMPDQPSLPQFFLWQKLNPAPEYPVLTKFLDFWEAELDGKIHSVRVAHTRFTPCGSLIQDSLRAGRS